MRERGDARGDPLSLDIQLVDCGVRQSLIHSHEEEATGHDITENVVMLEGFDRAAVDEATGDRPAIGVIVGTEGQAIRRELGGRRGWDDFRVAHDVYTVRAFELVPAIIPAFADQIDFLDIGFADVDDDEPFSKRKVPAHAVRIAES